LAPAQIQGGPDRGVLQAVALGRARDDPGRQLDWFSSRWALRSDGAKVSYDSEAGPKGPKAANVEVVRPATQRLSAGHGACSR